MSQQYRYRAFISYSHADEVWGSWLHKAIERYRIPRRLVGQQTESGPVPDSLFPVFRDREELASAHELGTEIKKALEQSHSLIVICSPAAARSHWTNEEIKHFKSLGRASQVFCLIVDGEPNDPTQECFPQAIKFEVNAAGELTDAPAEPIAADARPGKDGKSDAKLKLIAGMLGLGFNDLKQRELAARNRRLTILSAVASGIAFVTIGLAVIATQARDEAQVQRQIAETRQQQAEGLIQFMLGDLREKLEPIGRLEILDAVGDQAMAYFGSVEPESLSDRELSARAKALRQVGNVRALQGKLEQAAPAFREALVLDEEIVRRSPGDGRALFNVGQSQFYVGYGHYLKGQYQQGLNWFLEYDQSAERLLALDPDKPEWLLEKQYTTDTLATLYSDTQDYQRCIRALDRSLRSARQLLAGAPGHADYLDVMASAYFKRSSCESKSGQLAASTESLAHAAEIYSGLLQRFAEDSERALALAIVMGAQSGNSLARGDFEAARAQAKRAVDTLQRVAESDPENARWRAQLLSAKTRLAEAEALRGELEESIRISRGIFSNLATDLNSVHERADVATNLVRLAALRLMAAPAEWSDSEKYRFSPTEKASLADALQFLQSSGIQGSLQRLFCALAWRREAALEHCSSSTACEPFEPDQALDYVAASVCAYPDVVSADDSSDGNDPFEHLFEAYW